MTKAQIDQLNAKLTKEFADVIGKRIVSVEAAPADVQKALDMDCNMMNPMIAINLDGGKILVPLADAEGNGPGWLTTLTAS